MSLIINSQPAVIDNSGKWNVTTDVVEDSTHFNVRIRADIIITGFSDISAAVEKPIGISDFDFFSILKALVPGITYSRNSRNLYFASGDGPVVSYSPTFTEVWEDATGVTTEGADITADNPSIFVPAVGDGNTFSSTYVLGSSDSKFACLSLPSGACKFYTYRPNEFWLIFFYDGVSIDLNYSKDGGDGEQVSISLTDGWGAIIINENDLMAGVTNYLEIFMSSGGDPVSEAITIYVDNSQIEEREVLEFDGLLGGKEYLPFAGIKNKKLSTIRSYYTGQNKEKRPLQFTGIRKQLLQTLLNDMEYSNHLDALLISENVKKMLPDYVDPIEVTVTTDTIQDESTDMFTNDIEIEYKF